MKIIKISARIVGFHKLINIIKLLYNLTKEVVNKPLAIFWGDKLVFSPIVREPIKNRKVQIVGLSDNFDVNEIDELVDILNSGIDMQITQIK